MSQQKIKKSKFLKFNFSSGFTLIELIVVITILAILSTIAFISFSDYNKNARDSIRISDLSSINKALGIYQTTNSILPFPDGYLEFKDIAGTISYQGSIEDRVSNILGIGKVIKDPLDNNYYVYTVNPNRKRGQILGYLESTNNASYTSTLFFIENAYADVNVDLVKRYTYTKGDYVGVFLNNTTNQPINYNDGSGGIINLSTTHSGTIYKAILSNNSNISTTPTGTGITIGNKVRLFVASNSPASSQYPRCDTSDITLSNGQVWAACNVGATVAFTGISLANLAGSTDPYSDLRPTLGSYFQWGRNDDITSTSITNVLASAGTLSNTVGHTNFIHNWWTSAKGSWISTPDNNLWGGSGTTGTGGTLISQGSPAIMQGPCATGYHVPTYKEWCNAINSIDHSIECYTIANSGSLRQYPASILSELKLPPAGNRGIDGASTGYEVGNRGFYWSSTPAFNTDEFAYTAYFLDFHTPGNALRTMYHRGQFNGYSVRCLKN
ncbi:MAG: FISUMP domain-containing protein [Candidatus Gracilibacteria bacterium]|nr:FISUMP domain-containing protein [Candidatus Gracilibacteria bacterium]